MKYTLAIICVLAFAMGAQSRVLTSPNTIFAQSTAPPADCVWLYPSYHFNGNYDEICFGNDVEDTKATFGNRNVYSSIRVGSLVKAELYKYRFFNKLRATATQDKPNLKKIKANDLVESVRIRLKEGITAAQCESLFQ